MSTENEPMIRTSDLRKVFRSGQAELTVLAGVNLAVAPGEMVAVIGPSGAGKSTLLHLLGALDSPTSGTIYFNGRELGALSEAERARYRNGSVGFVWQRHHLLPDFTATENVAMPLLLQGIPHDEALAGAATWLGQVGLAERAQHRAGELSGGEQQRAALARALVGKPSLLLADEPTGNLDFRTGEMVFRMIEQLHRAYHLTSIIVTHNLAFAAAVAACGRVLQLAGGQLLPAQDWAGRGVS